jgi:hypothetical protein
MESGKLILIKKIALLLFLAITAEAYSIQVNPHSITQGFCSGNDKDLCISQENDSGEEDLIDQINTFDLAQFPEYKNQDFHYITSLLTFVVAVWQPPKLS